jgi:alpha-mannosidase
MINDGIHGSDALDGTLRLSLLRSSGYCVHPIYDRPLVPEDRFLPRSEQGERIFRFEISGGAFTDRTEKVEREALTFNEAPVVMSFFPSGLGVMPKALAEISDDVLVMGAMKRAVAGRGMMLRLYNPTGDERNATLTLPLFGLEKEICFGPYEVKTFVADSQSLTETDAMEGILDSYVR